MAESIEPHNVLGDTCDRLRTAVRSAFEELDRSMGVSDTIAIERRSMADAWKRSNGEPTHHSLSPLIFPGSSSVNYECSRARLRGVRQLQRLMDQAQDFILRDEVIFQTLDTMGYIDDTRRATFASTAIRMNDPGPRLSSSPASNREASRRSVTLVFDNPRMEDARKAAVSANQSPLSPYSD
jgi:hypothetical protein